MLENNNINQYDINIDNTRNQNGQTGVNINHNPYLNKNANQNLNTQNNQMNQNIQNNQNTFFNKSFLGGAVLGAAAIYLLTNKNAQDKIFNIFSKGSDMLSAGVEELKERCEDLKAQMKSNQE